MTDFKFKMDSDNEKCMTVIDELRQESIYPHPPSDYTAECIAKG